MLSEKQKKQVLGRLRRIEGQAGGLIRMVEADKYCMEVLQQIAAAQGALAQVCKQLLHSHLHTCVVDAFGSGESERQEQVIEELVDLFARNSRSGPAR